MKRLFARLRRDQGGVTAIEFAFVAPLLIFLVVGILQMGQLFYSHSAVSHAVSEGARYATIHPRPTTAQVIAFVQSRRPLNAAGTFTTPTVTYTQNATTRNWFANVSMTYTVRLEFIFFEYDVVLTSSRQANVYEPVT